MATTEEAEDEYFGNGNGSGGPGPWSDPEFWTNIIGGAIDGIGTIVGASQANGSADVQTPGGQREVWYVHPNGQWYPYPPGNPPAPGSGVSTELTLSNPLVLLGLAWVLTR